MIGNMTDTKDDRFLIITGLSGSGKTCVSRFLEDLGYYCIDNLPAKLIPTLVNLWTRQEVEIEKAALVVDVREAGFQKKFPEVLQSIRKKVGLTLIFLEASDETLIKRFSESRRPHPLSRKSIAEGIRLERESLSSIKKMADEVIDTSLMTVVKLNEHLALRFSAKKGEKLQVVMVSFGYKYGVPLDSDLVFDTRFLPNPHYIDTLRDKDGMNKNVKEYVLKFKETKLFLKELFRFVDFLMPCFKAEGKSYLTIAIGCTGGKHRSVVLSEELKKHLNEEGLKTRAYHRDIYK
jgi:UPF0042 nucleotide-binding protein